MNHPGRWHERARNERAESCRIVPILARALYTAGARTLLSPLRGGKDGTPLRGVPREDDQPVGKFVIPHVERRRAPAHIAMLRAGR